MLAQEIFRNYFDEAMENEGYDTNGAFMKELYQALDITDIL